MRVFPLLILCGLANALVAQFDQFTGRYMYAFVEDSSALVPLQGKYQVEYLARGRWWSYLDPHTPVNYPGEVKKLKPLIDVSGSPLMAVELDKNYTTPDNKLRVVRGLDTMIVDIAYGHVEERMRARTAKLGVPPRPPVLVPFRRSWTDIDALVEEPQMIELTEQFDALWRTQSVIIKELFDTARYDISLMMDFEQVGPLEIPIMRDPNYTTHMLHFPASGPGAHFELYRQDSLGVTDTIMSRRVDMPPDGETGLWLDITHLQYGKYTTHMVWGDNRSTFYLIFGW